MNNKGQSLVVFIISIPIFIILVAFIVDGFIISYEKAHLSSLTKTIIKNNIDKKDANIIKDTFIKNDIKDNINVITDDNLHIYFNHQVPSFFGKVIGKNNYKISINLIGTNKNGKTVIEKGS